MPASRRPGIRSRTSWTIIQPLVVTAALSLALLDPSEQKRAVDRIGWSTTLLVGGVIAHLGVLWKLGAIDSLGLGVSGLGSPLLRSARGCTGVPWSTASSL